MLAPRRSVVGSRNLRVLGNPNLSKISGDPWLTLTPPPTKESQFNSKWTDCRGGEASLNRDPDRSDSFRKPTQPMSAQNLSIKFQKARWDLRLQMNLSTRKRKEGRKRVRERGWKIIVLQKVPIISASPADHHGYNFQVPPTYGN